MDAVWNVEEHRYTKTADQREREREMVTAEMIPTKKTSLTFLEKVVPQINSDSRHFYLILIWFSLFHENNSLSSDILP